MQVHDFPHLGEGKAIPYDTYDVMLDRALVNVGITHDTAEFAVESIRQWWRLMGSRPYLHCCRRAGRRGHPADSGQYELGRDRGGAAAGNLGRSGRRFEDRSPRFRRQQLGIASQPFLQQARIERGKLA